MAAHGLPPSATLALGGVAKHTTCVAAASDEIVAIRHLTAFVCNSATAAERRYAPYKAMIGWPGLIGIGRPVKSG